MPMRDIADRFEEFLRKQGLRLTRQRAEILKSIYGTHKHVSADDLYDRLRKSDANNRLKISRATVYRTLSLLEEGGFVDKLDVPSTQGALYEHTLEHEHHDHMVCDHCGRIIEFHDDRLEAVQAAAVERHGFLARSHRLNVFGICATCQKKGVELPPDPHGHQKPGDLAGA